MAGGSLGLYETRPERLLYPKEPTVDSEKLEH